MSRYEEEDDFDNDIEEDSAEEDQGEEEDFAEDLEDQTEPNDENEWSSADGRIECCVGRQ
jgi:hypothetical protein